MNMALRPFSLLLLLLVVMIPAISTMKDDSSTKYYEKMRCNEEKTWFCFKYDATTHLSARFQDAEAYQWSYGGITIVALNPNEWIVHFSHYFDHNGQAHEAGGCKNSIVSTYMSVEIQCKAVIDTPDGSYFEQDGFKIYPIHYRSGWSALVYTLHVGPGSFIADKFQLFANPEMTLKFDVRNTGDANKPWQGTTPGFKPYECMVHSNGVKPDDSAVKAAQSVSIFTCGAGLWIFLEGTSTYEDTVYCGGEGWFSKDKTLILKRIHIEKESPYCVKDMLFEDCTNNKCFVFGDALKQAQPAAKLIKVDDPFKIENKRGAYLVFESDTKWNLHVAYTNNRNGDLKSITIGKLKFDISPTGSKLTSPYFIVNNNNNNVDMKIEKNGPRLISGINGFMFTFEAKANAPEKDLMILFEFYKGVENKIKLDIDGHIFDADGVANFGKYDRTGGFIFVGENAETKDTPDVHNLFSCNDGKTIYLNNERTGLNEIRFTKKKGWLQKDGTPVSAIKDSSGKDAAVHCFTVCQEATLTLTTDPKPQKNDPAKMEYKCNGGLVKVDSNFYASVSCENDQWKGDGNIFTVPPPKFTFGAECYGAFKFVRDCVPTEENDGCGKVKIEGVGVSCEDGFLLTLLGQDDTKIRTSLRVDKNDQWVEGDAVIAKTKTGDRPQCYSKCAPRSVIGTNVANDKYSYDKNTKKGKMSCPEDTNVLVLTLDGKKQSFVKEVTCDNEGWKNGGEKVAEHQSGVLNPECFKSCAPVRLAEEVCPTGWDKKRDCGEGMRSYSAQRILKCQDTHVLFVNDQQMSTALECTKAGWVTRDATPALIIDHTTNYDKPVKAECFAKCGKKLATFSADITPIRTDFQLDLKCTDNTHMISYTLNGAQQDVDTLEDLKCEDKKGWMAGSTSISTFSAETAVMMNIKCKQSCNEGLVKDACSGHDQCLKASFTNNEWSCTPSHVLWANDVMSPSSNPIKCEKLQFKSDKFTITRTSPTSPTTISCYSICDEEFFTIDPNTIQKSHDKSGFTTNCKSELHHLEISYAQPSPTKEYLSEFKCTADQLGRDAITADHLGQTAKITCRNKCENRFKEDSCAGDTLDKHCVKPILDAQTNKLVCDDAHVLRIKKDENSPAVQYIFGNALECKKDGFYENDENVLPFNDDPKEDVKLKYGIACISTCDSELVRTLDINIEITGSSDPARNNKDVMECKRTTDHILHVTYGDATVRVFGPATCVKDIGWTGINAKETPSGAADNSIVNFAGNKALMKAECINACKDVAEDAIVCNGLPPDFCDSAKKTAPTLSDITCKDNYRLFLNGKNTDGKAIAATNVMKCTKEGWKEDTEMIVDFKDAAVDITKPLGAICKNKCHPDFIEFSHKSCPQETECSEPKYDTATKEMRCADTTEVLVIEYAGEIKEAFYGATCGNDGWSSKPTDNSQTKEKLIDLSDNKAIHYDYHIKARCEQLCAFNVDKTALNPETERGLVYDREKKTLTCNGTDEMLALDSVGVYADMQCKKDGWYTDLNDRKIAFEAIISDDVAGSQKTERAKKFTCVTNDCMRPLACEGEECVNPDFEKKKYEMSCEAPTKIAKKNSREGDISYSSLRCFNGDWKKDKNDQQLVIPQLTDLKDNIAERERFDMVCTASACAKCKEEDKDLGTLVSTTDANIKGADFISGSFTTCSGYKCGTGLQYVIEAKEGGTTKLKYYESKGGNTIKCTKTDENSPSTYSSPDRKENVARGTRIGCVSQIPCNEHRPLKTDCKDLEKTGCDSDGLQQSLKNGSISSTEPVKCGTLGQLYYNTNTANNGWKVVKELQCTRTGEWRVKYLENKEKSDTEKTIEKLPETMGDDAKTHPHFICAKKDPNPDAKKMENDPITQTCSFCPFPPILTCKDDCKKADDHATATNTGTGKCEMTIANGRFKINGGEETDKGTVLTCQMIDGKYPWMTPDGKKIDSLAVIMKDADNINTGAIAAIAIGVILVLGLIVFAMVYFAIKKRKEAERQEKLKSKGLEQKMDSIIDAATIVDDTKTLVL